MNHQQTLAEILRETIPKTYCDEGCDGNGTYPVQSRDGADPAPCQYCHETRLPAIDEAINRIEALIKEAEQASRKYEELIMAVGNKYPNETRHETALRYIKSAENQTDVTSKKESNND